MKLNELEQIQTAYTLRATMALRFRQIPATGTCEPFIEMPMILQQAWECIETGEIEWRDVPVFMEKAQI